MSREKLSSHTDDLPDRITALKASARELAPSTEPGLARALEELQRIADELLRAHGQLCRPGPIESQRQYYHALFDSAPVAYLVTDASGRIREANQAAARLFDHARHELVGASLYDLVVEGDGQEFARRVEQFHDSGVTDIDVRLRRGEEARFDAAITLARIDDHSPAGALRWIVRDVTGDWQAQERSRQINAELESRLLERNRLLESARRAQDDLLASEQMARTAAEEANRAKDEFLATLSHELRTPVNVVLGLIWRLRTGRLNPEASAKALETVERNTRVQVRLIDDLLDVSRIITGKFKLDVHRVDLRTVIEAARDAARPAAAAKGIRLDAVLAASAGAPVHGDPTRLHQVFWNLLSNAVKFTPPGGCIEIRLDIRDDDAEVSVSDNGVGIASEFLPFVFDRFRQADSTSTRVFGGLGLGLAIVRHVVELHGGTVHVQSPGRNQGARFAVRLPLAAASERTMDRRHARKKKVHVAPAPALDGVRVLVAEGEPEARHLIAATLREFGANVTTVGSVREAIDEVSHVAPDVLLSDLRMGGENGYALIRKIRALGAERGEQIPAAAVTSYARSEDRVQALLAGFQMYVAKPVNPSELAAVVASLAGRTKHRRLKTRSH